MFTVFLLILILINIGYISFQLDQLYMIKRRDGLSNSQQEIVYWSLMGAMIIAFITIVALKAREVKRLIRGYTPGPDFIMV